jgi:hypothetical protein
MQLVSAQRLEKLRLHNMMTSIVLLWNIDRPYMTTNRPLIVQTCFVCVHFYRASGGATCLS